MHISYKDATTKEEDSVVIARSRGQMRASSRTRRVRGSTGSLNIDTYGQQPGNSSKGLEQRHASIKETRGSQNIRTQKADNTP